MKLGVNKDPYIALGLLVSLMLSIAAEVVFMFNGDTVLFSQSISGLQYQFLLLPVFILLGVIGGCLFWFISNKRK